MIINGKEISKNIISKLKEKIVLEKRAPKLGVILVGDNPASLTYVKAKKRACEECGINFELYHLHDIEETELINLIHTLNNDDNTDGILLQLPLPKGFNQRKCLDSIDSNKDVDGLTSINAGKLFTDQAGFVPCTPLGVIEIFKAINYDLCGKRVLMVGRSNLVGLPLSRLLTKYNATVTLAHSKTRDLAQLSQQHDVLIVAIGQAKFIDASYVHKDMVVIDVGINRIESGLCGDVDFEQVAPIVASITPVPKGVGPLTIAMLLSNTYEAYKKRTQ